MSHGNVIKVSKVCHVSVTICMDPNNVALKYAIPGSISSTDYAKLLYALIPKAQKDTDKLTEFLRF